MSDEEFLAAGRVASARRRMPPTRRHRHSRCATAETGSGGDCRKAGRRRARSLESAADRFDHGADRHHRIPAQGHSAGVDAVRRFVAPGLPIPPSATSSGLAENAWDFNDPNAMPGFGPLDCSDGAACSAPVERVLGGVRSAADIATRSRSNRTPTGQPNPRPSRQPCRASAEAVADARAVEELSEDRMSSFLLQRNRKLLAERARRDRR